MIKAYTTIYVPTRSRKQANNKNNKATLVLILIVIAVSVLVKPIEGSPPPIEKKVVTSSNIQTNFEVDLNELSALITDDMFTFTANQSDIDGLYEVAKGYPEYTDKIDFFIKHIGAYSQTAVTTILMSPEKTDFILLEPFYKEDGACEAKINIQKGEVPFLIQYDSRWAFHTFGSSAMGNTACGPTCLSMVAIGLSGNTEYTPPYIADFAMNNGYYVYGAGTSWLLFTDGASSFGVSGEVIPLDEDTMQSRLNDGQVLIASMQKGDFTRSGHFIVIHSYGSGGFCVYDPSSVKRSKEGWSFDKLYPQIAQVWSFRKA